MAVKLLLYEKRETGGQPNQVILRNSVFESSIDGWSQTVEDDWVWGGAGVLECIGTEPSYIFTIFASDMVPGYFYDVEFDIDAWNGENLTVQLGNFEIGTITGIGHYVFTFHAPDEQFNCPITLGFRTTSSTLACKIDNVYIYQNVELSPGTDLITYYVESCYVDMYPNVNIGLNFQVADVQKISGKLGSFSKRFEVPGSQNNREAFSHLYSNNIVPSVFDPRNKTKCKLIDEAEGSVILDGWLNLSNISYVRNEVRFEVEMYDNSFGLLDGIKGRKMKELDLSEFNHLLTVGNVTNTWTSGWTWENGYVYPLMYKEIPEYFIGDDFFPWFWDRHLFEKVVRDEAGFGFTLSPLATNVITNKITSPNGTMPKVNQEFAQSQGIDVTGSGDVYHAQGTTSYFAGSTGPTITPDINYSFENNDPSGLWNLESGRYKFTAPSAGDYDVSFSVPVSIALESLSLTSPNTFSNTLGSFVSPTPLSIKVQLVSETFNVVIGESDNIYTRTLPSTQSASAMTFNTESETFQYGGIRTLAFNEKLYLRIVVDNQLTFAYYSPFPTTNIARPKDTVTVTSGGFLRINYSIANEISEGAYIAMNDFLPAISMEDFLVDQATEMNLFILANGAKRIDFVTRTEFYDPTKPIVDWSSLLDKDSPVKIEYLTEVSSSEVEFGYKKSDEFYNNEYKSITKGPQYGDRTFNYGTDFYSTKEEIRLKTYEPTPILANLTGDLLPAIPAEELPSAARNLLWGDDYPNNEPIKIVYHDSGGTLTSIPYNTRRTALHINSITDSSIDINFGPVEFVLTNTNLTLTSNNLYNLFYADQTKLFKKTRMYTAWFKLNNQKVEEIVKDMGRRIWIKEFNNYFILSSIVDFNPIENGVTKVELLEWIPSSGVFDAPSIAQATHPWEAPVVKSLGVYGNVLNIGYDNKINTTFGYDKGGSVFGSKNTLYGGTYGVWGTGNTIDNGSNSVFLFGTDNVHVTGGTYANFFNGALTINQYRSTFYSAVTMSSTGVTVGTTDVGLSGITVGGPSGVSITYSSVTINGIEITSATTAHNYVQGGVNTYTGGTVHAPTVNVVANPSFTAVTVGSGVSISYSSVTIQGLVITSGFTSGISGNFLPISGGTMTGDTIFQSGKTITYRNTNGTGSATFSATTSVTGDRILETPNASGELALVPKCRLISSDFHAATDWQYYFCDTSGAGFRVDLPTPTFLGEQYHFFDKRGSFSTGNVTLSGGTNKVGPTTAFVLNGDHKNCFVTWNGTLWSPFVSA